jgi:hypothetical protein
MIQVARNILHRIFMQLAAESRDWKLTTAEMQRLSKLNLRPTKRPPSKTALELRQCKQAMRAATMTVTESKGLKKVTVYIGEAMPLIAAQSLRRVGMRSRSPGTMVRWLSYTTGTCEKLSDHRQGRRRCERLVVSRLFRTFGLAERRPALAYAVMAPLIC